MLNIRHILGLIAICVMFSGCYFDYLYEPAEYDLNSIKVIYTDDELKYSSEEDRKYAKYMDIQVSILRQTTNYNTYYKVLDGLMTKVKDDMATYEQSVIILNLNNRMDYLNVCMNSDVVPDYCLASMFAIEFVYNSNLNDADIKSKLLKLFPNFKNVESVVLFLFKENGIQYNIGYHLSKYGIDLKVK